LREAGEPIAGRIDDAICALSRLIAEWPSVSESTIRESGSARLIIWPSTKEDCLPTGLMSEQLRDLVRRGAEVRLGELREETSQIEAMLGTGNRRSRKKESRRASTAPRRRRRRMSAAQRKAVGERMRKYWAARRRAEARK